MFRWILQTDLPKLQEVPTELLYYLDINKYFLKIHENRVCLLKPTF